MGVAGKRVRAKYRAVNAPVCLSMSRKSPPKGVIQNRVTLRQHEATEYRIPLKLCLMVRHIVTLQRGHQPTRLPSHSS